MSQSEAVYNPEWLEYEAILGARPAMSGDIAVDVPLFNHLGSELAKLWKPLDEEPEIVDQTFEPGNIPVRIYKPQNVHDKLPVMIFFHGGGYIAGNLDTEDRQCRYLAANTPCILVSVDYPLAPETQVAEIIKSAVAAVECAVTHDPALSPSGKIIIAGGSAGGSLATQVMYSLVQSGKMSGIIGLVLMFPFASFCGRNYKGPYADQHTSYQDNAKGVPFITTDVLENAHKLIGLSETSPAHCVLLAESSVLSQFPRTYVTTAEHDPCRDDGKVLVKRLNDESKNGAREDYYEGFPHYFHWFPTVPTTYTMMEKLVKGVQWVIQGNEK